MLTRQEAERLAASVHALRPDWPLTSLLTFLKKRERRPLLDIGIELTYVALLPDTKTPARIDEAGPWKSATSTAAPTPLPRYAADDDCAICNNPRDGHHDDHEWRPRLPPEEWARPTQEQREFMRKERERLEHERTAAPEPEVAE
jgi:hypothetical protein